MSAYSLPPSRGSLGELPQIVPLGSLEQGYEQTQNPSYKRSGNDSDASDDVPIYFENPDPCRLEVVDAIQTMQDCSSFTWVGINFSFDKELFKHCFPIASENVKPFQFNPVLLTQYIQPSNLSKWNLLWEYDLQQSTKQIRFYFSKLYLIFSIAQLKKSQIIQKMSQIMNYDFPDKRGLENFLQEKVESLFRTYATRIRLVQIAIFALDTFDRTITLEDVCHAMVNDSSIGEVIENYILAAFPTSCEEGQVFRDFIFPPPDNTLSIQGALCLLRRAGVVEVADKDSLSSLTKLKV